MIAKTPRPPYFAVIFTSIRTPEDDGYAATAAHMEELAGDIPGFLGMETARNGVGITVSYWQSEESIRAWKRQSDHRMAQQDGRDKWYSQYKVRICKVERDYGFGEAF